MIITLEIPPDMEVALLEKAALQGQAVPDYLLTLVEADLNDYYWLFRKEQQEVNTIIGERLADLHSGDKGISLEAMDVRIAARREDRLRQQEAKIAGMNIPDFLGAFYFYKTEALTTRDGRDVSIECQEIGNLVLATGSIVACDGLIPSSEPFIQRVTPGSYPVVLSLALTSHGQTVACAMLRFSCTMPERWEVATIADQDMSDRIGYGVDTGTGCFAGLEAMQTLLAAPERYELLRQEVNQTRIDWVNFRVNDSRSCNVIVFSSGEGDGLYPSYFGYDVTGNTVCLATDFGIIAPLPNKEIDKPNPFQLGLGF